MFLSKKIVLDILFVLLMLNYVASSKHGDTKASRRIGKAKKGRMALNTATGALQSAVNQVQSLPHMEMSRKFRTPCKTGNKCGRVMKQLMVPKLVQLENTIMGIMKEIAKMPPGARLPDKLTKTEPGKLLYDQNYKEEVCQNNVEQCLREDKRRKRVLKKLFFKKYNGMRQELIGYGGRRLWGGEGNLFY